MQKQPHWIYEGSHWFDQCDQKSFERWGSKVTPTVDGLMKQTVGGKACRNCIKACRKRKWDCKSNVVFVPKYRRKSMFLEIRRFLGPMFQEKSAAKGVPDYWRAPVARPRSYVYWNSPKIFSCISDWIFKRHSLRLLLLVNLVGSNAIFKVKTSGLEVMRFPPLALN